MGFNIYAGIGSFKSWCVKTWKIICDSNKETPITEALKIGKNTSCTQKMLWLGRTCHMMIIYFTITNYRRIWTSINILNLSLVLTAKTIANNKKNKADCCNVTHYVLPISLTNTLFAKGPLYYSKIFTIQSSPLVSKFLSFILQFLPGLSNSLVLYLKQYNVGRIIVTFLPGS